MNRIEQMNALRDAAVKESLRRLRDEFAKIALAGLIRTSTVEVLDANLLADSSYKIADAMLKARGV